MLQMVRAFFVSRALYIAATLGLADLLKDEPKSSKELAQATGTDTSALYRLMRTLLEAAGFEVTKIIPTQSEMTVIECARA